jgi:spore germination protein KC
MKKINILLIVMMIMFLVLLSGCWDYRDVNELYVVSGIAVDKSDDGQKYLLTAEVADVKSAGKEAKIDSKLIQIEGETLFDAIRNMIMISGKKLYFSHMKIVLISQDVAREGITQITDLITRDNEPRLETNMLVSKEKTARELLEYQSIGEILKCSSIYEMLESQRELSKAPFIENYKFIQSLSSEGGCAILPVAGSTVIDGQKNLEISGTAIFKKDKLIGFLDGDDTKYLLFIRDMVKSGILPEMGKQETTKHSVSLEIFESKTKLKPKYADGKVSIDINVKTVTGIGEQDGMTNFADEKGRDILKSNAEDSLKKNIERVIKKVQHEYGTDIFEFGKTIKIEMPSVWKSIYPEWDDLFKEIDVNVATDVDIRSSGFLSKHFSKGE